MPGRDDLERDPETDELEANTDWRTAEIPHDDKLLAQLHRRTPKPCLVCGHGQFVLLKHQGELAFALGLSTHRGDVTAEVLICRRCGRMDAFVVDPGALLRSPAFAAVIVEAAGVEPR